MKKKLLCPQCGGRLIDTEGTVKSETRAIDFRYDNSMGKWIPDYYLKCWKCKANIGIRKVV
ncbi:MAG: hypothetical protein K2M73_10925 [Lachnospiraceae bacterium]|nr:hypothetical protein [Lachnospiraceae bacterium]